MTHGLNTLWRIIISRGSWRPTLICAALVLFSSPLRADVVAFSQPIDPTRQHFQSDLNFASGASVQDADNFAFLQPATLSSLRWWGSYNNSTAEPDNFRIRFFSDAGSKPAVSPFLDVAPIALTRLDTGLLSPSGKPTFQYSSILPPGIALNGATPYYLSVVNQTTRGWNWAGDGGIGFYVRKVDGAPWVPFNDNGDFNRAFELLRVPEPGSLDLFTSLLVPFATVHRTARRRIGLRL